MASPSATPGARTANTLSAIRQEFPGATKWVYLDTAARGLLSTRVRRAVDRYLDERTYEGGDKSAMFATVERVRKRFAALVGADPDEVAFTKSVAEGLNAVAAAFPWRDGDNVVVCPDLEHPSNVYPWLRLQRVGGIEVRKVPARDGRMPVERMVEAVDERTRLITVSTVSFAPGFRTDLAPLAEVCRRQGIFLLADGAQSVGMLHADVGRLGVDGLSVSTQKGLLGFYGMGLLYCRREWAERMHPAYVARFSIDLGGAHEASIGDLDDYRLRPAARRFDLGNYNFIGATAAEQGLAHLLDAGTEAIEAHVCALSHRLATGLLELGLPVCGGAPGPHLANIVSVGDLAGGHDSADDPAMNALHRTLADNGVKLSIRRGTLRFSMHLYNDEADVDRVVELARGWIGR